MAEALPSHLEKRKKKDKKKEKKKETDIQQGKSTHLFLFCMSLFPSMRLVHLTVLYTWARGSCCVADIHTVSFQTLHPDPSSREGWGQPLGLPVG